MNNSQITVIDTLVVDKQNKNILIQQRSATRKLFPLCWDFVGGHLEPDETIEQCIKRELFEETRMHLVSIIKQIHEFKWEYGNHKVTDKVFMIEAQGEIQLEEGKAIQAKWIKRDEAHLLLKPGETHNEMHQAVINAFDALDKSTFTN